MNRPFKSEEYRNADFKYKRNDVVKCICPDQPLYHNKIGTIEHVDIESKAWDEEDPNYYVTFEGETKDMWFYEDELMVIREFKLVR